MSRQNENDRTLNYGGFCRTMTSNINLLESIFSQALEIESESERDAFVQNQCGENEQLRSQVIELIQNHFQAGDFLSEKKTSSSIGLVDQWTPGTTIGPYRLTQIIGEGGFGIVYRAEQVHPLRREVALKLLKAGMDSRQVVARFEHERQALALMDHPNIARVFDAGTCPRGRPYFVMELFDGVPITKYCDEHQLDIRERLSLFLIVCRAVHYSHHKGIIHRDLKPSNVLVANVDGQHVVKIIDFGIAKALGQNLADRTAWTSQGSILGTLEYMSPEQAEFNAVDIDTRSDIFGLGILLFELLTGSTPLKRQKTADIAMDAVLRMIREDDVPSPSKRLSEPDSSLKMLADQRQSDPARLCKEIQGELDWITTKCLEKDRTRRYDSASELAQDIERFLNNEAVLAGPPSAWYKLRKFTRRHWQSMLAAIMLFVLLSSTTIVMTVAYAWVSKERHEKELALNAEQARRKDARAALDSLSSLVIADWLTRQTTLLPEHRAFLANVVEAYEKFANETESDIESQRGVASASDRVASIQRSLGQSEEAERAWLRSRDKYLELISKYPNEDDFQERLASVYLGLSAIYAETGRFPEADANRSSSLAIHRELFAKFPNEHKYANSLAALLNRQGILMKNLKKFDEAEKLYSEAKSIQLQLVNDFPDNLSYREELGETLLNFGFLLELLKRRPEAEATHRAALAEFTYVANRQPKEIATRVSLAKSLNNLGNFLRDQDELAEAESMFLRSLEITMKLKEEFPSIPDYTLSHSQTLNNLGILQKNSNRIDAAIGTYSEAVETLRHLEKNFPTNINYKNALAGSMVNLGRVYLISGKPTDAQKILQEAEPFHRKALDSNSKHPDYRSFFRNNRWRLAEANIELKDFRSADSNIEQFYEIATELPKDAYTAASLWSRCVELVERNTDLTPESRLELVNSFSQKAIRALKAAIDLDPELSKKIAADEVFRPLQSSADFQQLLPASSEDK